MSNLLSEVQGEIGGYLVTDAVVHIVMMNGRWVYRFSVDLQSISDLTEIDHRISIEGDSDSLVSALNNVKEQLRGIRAVMPKAES